MPGFVPDNQTHGSKSKLKNSHKIYTSQKLALYDNRNHKRKRFSVLKINHMTFIILIKLTILEPIIILK